MLFCNTQQIWRSQLIQLTNLNSFSLNRYDVHLILRISFLSPVFWKMGNVLSNEVYMLIISVLRMTRKPISIYCTVLKNLRVHQQ